jgi:hypothetical protein
VIKQNGKSVPKTSPIYQDILHSTAKEIGLYPLSGKLKTQDPYHISAVQEGTGHAFTDLLKSYPDIVNDAGYKSGFAALEKRVKSGKADRKQLFDYYQMQGKKYTGKPKPADINYNEYVQAGVNDSTSDELPPISGPVQKAIEFRFQPAATPPAAAFTPAQPVTTEPIEVPSPVHIPTNQEKLDPRQLYPELYAAATNRVEPVWAQQYNPQLKQPYQVSFQDRLDENTAAFNAAKNLVDYNPEALSTLAGQKYQANNSVLADEFRQNDATNRGIYNENIGILNDAQLRNLAIRDQQYVRQSTAKSKTKALDHEILSSVASKYLQHNLENKRLMAAESMTGMRFTDTDGDGVPDTLTWQGGNAPFAWNPVGPDGTKTGNPTLKREEWITDEYGRVVRKKTQKNEYPPRTHANGGSIASLYNKVYGKHR